MDEIIKLAYEVYPEKWWRDCDGDAWDANSKRREGFIEGYTRAIKDLKKQSTSPNN